MRSPFTPSQFRHQMSWLFQPLLVGRSPQTSAPVELSLLKLSLVVGFTLISLIGMLYTISAKIMLVNVRRFEEAATEQNVRRVLGALESEFDALKTEVADYAIWDDSIAFMEQADPNYIDSNLTVENIESLQLQLVAFVHLSGEIEFGQGFDLQAQRFIPLPRDLMPYLTPESPLLQHFKAEESKRYDRASAALLVLPESPILLGISPILASDGSGPPYGTLLIGRYLDATAIAHLSSQTQTALKLWPLNHQALPAEAQVAYSDLRQRPAGAIFFQTFNSHEAAGYTLLFDFYKNPAVLLQVDAPRSLYQQGLVSLQWLRLALIASGLFTGMMIEVLLWRLVKSTLEGDRMRQKAQQEAVLAEAQEIAHLGSWQFDVNPPQLTCSEELCRIFGQEPCGQGCGLEDITHHLYADDRPIFEAALRQAQQSGCPYSIEHRIVQPNGAVRFVFSQGHVSTNPSGELTQIVGTMLDITERKHAEIQLKASLQEKEVLLKEIHHRVKNNLQMVSSLLDLQAESLHEPAILDLFLESQRRIKVMALIHESLYQSEDLAQINFSAYIEQLLDDLLSSYPSGHTTLQTETQIDGVQLKADTVLTCGLIISELISNAIKHAFPDQKDGVIRIQFFLESAEDRRHHSGLEFEEQSIASHYRLTIGDNGVGIPEHIDIFNTESLGLQLVCLLVQKLDGSVTLRRGSGSTFDIVFPVAN